MCPSHSFFSDYIFIFIMLSLREANFSRMLLPFPDFKRTAVAFSPRPGFLVLGSSVKKVRVRNSPGNAGELSILVTRAVGPGGHVTTLGQSEPFFRVWNWVKEASCCVLERSWLPASCWLRFKWLFSEKEKKLIFREWEWWSRCSKRSRDRRSKEGCVWSPSTQQIPPDPEASMFLPWGSLWL